MTPPDRKKALCILTASQNQGLQQAFSIKKMRSPYVTYSKNVFIPLTKVCRNACGYCIFRKEPQPDNNILKKETIIQLLRKAESFKCTEVLFTCGEKPEVYPAVERELKEMGYTSLIEYVRDLCEYIVRKTSLFPHSNGGVLTKEEISMLKPFSASMGLMLENSSPRLMSTKAHRFSPGKHPALRLETLELAGKCNIPFTTGILVGIGETDLEIYRSLLDIQRIQNKYHHIQEIIIQNFKPKPETPMETFRPVSLTKLVNIVVLARLMFPDTSIQVPPNLNRGDIARLLKAGADDLGGISPVTPDYINPEYPWPALNELPFEKRERLCVYPKYISKEYLSDELYEKARSITDEEGYVMT
ncbi:MAG: 7,8-didemethyl-8-hydroxy-5-deazariboflavin synthase subunit CofG [Theionarchaea archaeon]|nr:7,8-didemethyl-8-hydroxy-5-deazariboflavin synthase subunit CofG [Theionarchaea archaeon]